MEPVVDSAKLVADGVLDGNPLTDFTLDDEFMASVLSYDFTAFCAAATTVLADAQRGGDWVAPVSCSDLLPTASIFLSNNPLVASKASPACWGRRRWACPLTPASTSPACRALPLPRVAWGCLGRPGAAWGCLGLHVAALPLRPGAHPPQLARGL